MRKDEKIKDHFELNARVWDGFVQAQFNYKKFDYFLAARISNSSYQRTGYFQNDNFPQNSLGKSDLLPFSNVGVKGGATYKMSGNHLFSLHAAHFSNAPNLRNSFSNSRQNNDVVRDLKNENINAVDLNYYLRLPNIKARITGYYIQDATEISFYYADGISGFGRNATTAFVQEVLSGIGKRQLGVEYGMEIQLDPTMKIKAAAAVGEFTYSKNPTLYLTSDDFDEVLDYGSSYLKNYKIAGGPQQAYQLGFVYRSPQF